VYIGALEDGLDDVHQGVHNTLGDPVFQQDNAKIHCEGYHGYVRGAQHSGHDMARQLARHESELARVEEVSSNSQDTRRSGQSEKDPCRGSHRHLEGRD